MDCTPLLAKMVYSCPVGNGSAWPWPVPFTAMQDFYYLMRLLVPLITVLRATLLKPLM